MTRASRPHRIAMVAACPFPSLRGSQVLIRELAEALAAAGHVVHVVTYPSGEHLVPIKGMLVHRSARVWPMAASPSWLGKLLLDIALMVALYRVVRAHQVEIIHAHNYEAPLVGYAVRWLLGTPVVYHSHNAMADELPCYFRWRAMRRVARWVGGALDRCVPRLADHCVALTEELRRYLLTCGVPGDRIVVVPPAVGGVGGPDASASAALFPGQDVILYAGNLDPYQRVEVLVRVLRGVSERRANTVLVLVVHAAGASATRKRLARLAATPGVHIVEAPTFTSTRALLGRADVVICPRASWSGFPIKLLNFMSFGRAIVVCKGAAKIVEDGRTGVVVPDGDEGAMIDAVVQLLANPSRRAQLGGAAQRAVIERYSWRTNLPRIQAIYATLVRREAHWPGRATGREKPSKIGLMAVQEDRISPRARTRRTGNE